MGNAITTSGWWLILAGLVAAFGSGCTRAPDQPTVHFYNWVDETGPDTLAEFERRTGIEVRLEALTSNRVLETKLLAGNSGFDVVVPSNNFLEHLTAAGALQKLDKSRLRNWRNLDPELLRRAAEFDPGNDYAIPYLWGTNGIGLELNAVTQALGGAPPRSFKLLFDPLYAEKLQSCGIVWMESEWLMTNLALLHLGVDPASENPANLPKVESLLQGTRKFVRYFDNYRGDSDLVSGEICIEPATSGSILQAQAQAESLQTGRNIAYIVPDEGGMLWIDLLVIPRDAPNVDAAYRFLDYLLEPRVIAAVTNATKFANANRASLPYVDAALRRNPLVYPDAETMRRLRVDRAESQDFSRLESRMYSRVRNQ